MKRDLWLLLVLVAFSFQITAQERGDLISAQLIESWDLERINDLYDGFGLPEFISPIGFDVDVYKIVFATPDARGEAMTVASGLVQIPTNGNACNFPMFVYCHGTNTYTGKTMTELGDEYQIGIPFTANGYVSVLPDYLGFGETPLDHPHCYIHAKSSATSTIDIMRATRHFCAENGVALSGQNFITGYSEGGFVSMAALREIQELHLDEFDISAAAPGSGPYDVSGTMIDSILQSPVFSNPFYLLFTAESYQYVYGGLYEDYESVLIEPFDSLAPLVFNREDPQNSNLLHWPGYSMLQPDFLEQVLTDDNHPFREVARDNDLLDWAPDFPMNFFYCEGDDQVPYIISLTAIEAYVANGSDPNLVQAVSAGAEFDHPSCAQPGLIGSKLYFDNFRVDCEEMINAGIENKALNMSISVYPNPSSDFVVIEAKEEMNNDFLEVELYDMAGKMIHQTAYSNGMLLSMTDLNLDKGNYILKIVGSYLSYSKILVHN